MMSTAMEGDASAGVLTIVVAAVLSGCSVVPRDRLDESYRLAQTSADGERPAQGPGRGTPGAEPGRRRSGPGRPPAADRARPGDRTARAERRGLPGRPRSPRRRLRAADDQPGPVGRGWSHETSRDGQTSVHSVARPVVRADLAGEAGSEGASGQGRRRGDRSASGRRDRRLWPLTDAGRLLHNPPVIGQPQESEVSHHSDRERTLMKTLSKALCAALLTAVAGPGPGGGDPRRLRRGAECRCLYRAMLLQRRDLHLRQAGRDGLEGQPGELEGC